MKEGQFLSRDMARLEADADHSEPTHSGFKRQQVILIDQLLEFIRLCKALEQSFPLVLIFNFLTEHGLRGFGFSTCSAPYN